MHYSARMANCIARMPLERLDWGWTPSRVTPKNFAIDIHCLIVTKVNKQ